MKIKYIIFVLLAIILLVVPASADFSNGYKYRQNHTLYGSTNAQVNYQVKLNISNLTGTSSNGTVYVGSKCYFPNFTDIRIENASGNVLPYWIQEINTTNAIVWVNVSYIAPIGTLTNISLYYNNSAATNRSNPWGVFYLFDHFGDVAGTPNTTLWTAAKNGVSTGVVAIGNDKLLESWTFTTSSSNTITSKSAFTRGFALGMREMKNDTGYGYYTTSFGNGATNQGEDGGTEWWVTSLQNSYTFAGLAAAADVIEKNPSGGAHSNIQTNSVDVFSIQNQWIDTEYINDDLYGKTIVRNGSQIVARNTDSSYTGPYYILIGQGGYVGNSYGGNRVADWAYVRNYSYPEPIQGGYGSEETLTAPIAAFTSNVSYGNVSFVVQFNDTSTNNPDTWYWDFNDGHTSTTRNATNNFSSVIGNVTTNYTIKFNASNGAGFNWTNTTNITAFPIMAATTSDVTTGAAPLTVTFNSTYTNGTATTWLWDFGDTGTSTAQNTTHIYSSSGKYTVKLNASNAFSFNYSQKYQWINVTGSATPVASFTTNVSGGYAPCLVLFNDTSINSPTWWNWSFGDGTYSSTQNSTHTYTLPGTYYIVFNVSNTGGYNSTSTFPPIIVTLLPTPTPSPTPTLTTAPTLTTWGIYNRDYNITTYDATGVTQSSATLNGHYNFSDNCGFVYGVKQGYPTLSTQTYGVSNANYSFTLTNLQSKTRYYFRAICKNGTGEELSFVTLPEGDYTPISTTRYDEFINASTTGFDVNGMFNAGTSVFTDPLGNSFWGLVAIIFFVGLFLRQESPAIPLALAIFGGFALQSIIPGDYSPVILGIGGIVFAGWIYYVVFGKVKQNEV